MFVLRKMKKIILLLFVIILALVNLSYTSNLMAQGKLEGSVPEQGSPSSYNLPSYIKPCRVSREYAHSVCKCEINQCRLSTYGASLDDQLGRFLISAGAASALFLGPVGALAGLGLLAIYVGSELSGSLASSYICVSNDQDNNGVNVDINELKKYGFVLAKVHVVPPSVRTDHPDQFWEDWEDALKNTEWFAESKITVEYLKDDFANPGFGNLIPTDAVCKLASDGKTAYWSYNPYKIINPQANSQISRAMMCENPLLSSQDLFGNQVFGTSTFFGCLPNSINGLTAFIVRLVTGLAVFLNLLIILLNVASILGNPTTPDVIGASQKRIINSILVLMGIIFAIFFLRLFGIIVFGIELL